MPPGMLGTLSIVGLMAATSLPFMFLGQWLGKDWIAKVGVYIFVAEIVALVVWSFGSGTFAPDEFIRGS